MKINKILMGLGAVAALSLGACSNDEPANNQQPNPGLGQDQAYLAVQITEQTGRSRANEDGSTNDPNDFQNGTTYNESKVKTCDFYFYDEAGKYVMHTNTLWGDNGNNMPNIELKGQSVIVLDSLKEQGYPKYMVAILNQPSTFSAPLTLEELNTKLVGMSQNPTVVNYAGDENKYFVMTTSSFADQTMREGGADATYYFVNELVASDFCTTVEEAQNSKPVQVYVERLAAKVTVKINEESLKPVAGRKNTYAIRLSVAGALNTDTPVVDEEGNDASDYISDYELYVELLGWGLNATPKDSYYIKNIEPKTTEGLWEGNDATGKLGFTWNSTDFHRSYWAKSCNYNAGTEADFNYITYNKLSNKFWVNDDNAAGQNADYTAENTFGADFANKTENYKTVTSVYLQARVYDPKGDEGANFVEYRGLLFMGDRFMEYALSIANPNIYTAATVGAEGEATTTTYSQVKGILDLTEAEDGSVYTTFDLPAGTYYAKNAEGGYEVIADLNAAKEAVNNKLKETKGEGFKGGMMTYEIPIRHLRPIAKGTDGIAERTFAKQNLLEGDYGVVRNHYYAVSINSLKKLGNGVWNPDEDIIPENPPKDEEYFVGAQINILSWRVVNNDVDL